MNGVSTAFDEDDRDQQIRRVHSDEGALVGRHERPRHALGVHSFTPVVNR
jgi:hypothetical protein